MLCPNDMNSFLAFLEDVTYVFLLLFLSSYLQYYLCSFFVICIFSVRKKWSLKRDDYSIAFEMNSRKRAAYWSGSMVEIFSTLLKNTMGTIHILRQHILVLFLTPSPEEVFANPFMKMGVFWAFPINENFPYSWTE